MNLCSCVGVNMTEQDRQWNLVIVINYHLFVPFITDRVGVRSKIICHINTFFRDYAFSWQNP